MAVRVADTLGTYGAGGYPIVEAPDVETKQGDLQTDLDGRVEGKDSITIEEIDKLFDGIFN